MAYDDDVHGEEVERSRDQRRERPHARKPREQQPREFHEPREQGPYDQEFPEQEERQQEPREGKFGALKSRFQNLRKPREQKPQKPYVGDYGAPIEGTAKTVSVSFGMVALALVIGFVIGFLVFVALWLSSALTELLWYNVNEGLAPWFMPIILCTAGGLIIGLWTKYIGGDPEPLMKVLAEVKQTGSYRLRNIPASVVAFLLPLTFGGSVGLEAGLTGLIAAACSYIGRTLKAAGLRVKEVTDLTISASLTAIFGTPVAGIVMASEDAMPEGGSGRARRHRSRKAGRPDEARYADAVVRDDGGYADDYAAEMRPDAPASAASGDDFRGRSSQPARPARPNPDDYTFRRGAKIVLYCAAAFGSIGGLSLLTHLTGGMAGIPRFEAVEAVGLDLLWAIPCLIVAYAMTLLHHVAERGTLRLAKIMDRFTVLKPLIAGVAIGCVAVVLPKVLFCGEEQGFEIQQNWQAVGVAVLLGTGFVKIAATSLCLNMGWHGGNFFPNIYAGISAGYGMALLTGADPMLCVTVVTAAYLGGMFRRPLLVLALLILCFPVQSILWMGLACIIGTVLPVPPVLLGGKPAGE